MVFIVGFQLGFYLYKNRLLNFSAKYDIYTTIAKLFTNFFQRFFQLVVKITFYLSLSRLYRIIVCYLRLRAAENLDICAP